MPNLAIVGVYHPPQANHIDLSNRVTNRIDKVTTVHQTYECLIAGDFNQTDRNLTKIYSFSQMVNKPTREEVILDKCYSSISKYYNRPEILSHIGKSLKINKFAKVVITKRLCLLMIYDEVSWTEM